MSRRALTAIAVAVVILAGGCASQGPAVSARRQPSITTPMPIGVADPAPLTTTTTGAPPCNPAASYRPGRLAAPGELPAGSTMAAIRARGRLILGVGIGAYQLSFPNPGTGKMEGFEADIAREIAFAIFGIRDDATIEFRTLNSGDRERGIINGELDLVLAATTMTCDRWSRLSFSASYYTAGQRILVNRDSPIKSAADLGGKKVCASRNSTNIPVIQHLPAEPIAVDALNTNDCLLMLQQRQIDAVSTGDVILAGLAAQDPGTVIVGDRITEEPTGISIAKKSTDLVRFVNAVLERLKADGTWTRLQGQWLQDKLGPAEPPIPQYFSE